MNPQRLIELFNARALRERVLIAAAVLALLLAVWDSLLMKPLRNTSRGLEAELSSYSSISQPTDDSSDPHQEALRHASELQQQSQALDTQIATSARGFVPAQRMIEVLHDVLRRQGALTLISIRNLPVSSLIPTKEGGTATAPFVHSIELVIDGRYADIQDYVHELEALPWKFRWSLLELSTRSYPLNRVRLSLSTLSMDATWLGV